MYSLQLQVNRVIIQVEHYLNLWLRSPGLFKNDPSRFHQKSPMSLKAAVHDIRFIKRNLDIMKTHKSVMNISNIENKILPSEN